MGEVLIRPAQIEDAAAMLDVINPIIRAGGTTALEDQYTLAEQETFIDAIAPGEACHLAIDNASGVVVGFQGYTRHSGLPDDIADIATFVRIGEKGRGVGRKLSQTTFRAARAEGYAALNATIRADNFEGLAFYASMGFRDWSVARAAPLKSGRRVDRISKRRPL